MFPSELPSIDETTKSLCTYLVFEVDIQSTFDQSQLYRPKFIGHEIFNALFTFRNNKCISKFTTSCTTRFSRCSQLQYNYEFLLSSGQRLTTNHSTCALRCLNGDKSSTIYYIIDVGNLTNCSKVSFLQHISSVHAKKCILFPINGFTNEMFNLGHTAMRLDS